MGVKIQGKFMFGGPGCWKVYDHGEFRIAFHWLDLNDGEGEHEMLFMQPKRTYLGGGTYALRMRDAHILCQSDGYPTRKMIAECCAKACEVMGMQETRFTLHKIADALLKGIQDLLEMPPRQLTKAQQATEAPGVNLGEMAFKVNGKTVHERSIIVPNSSRLLN